MESGLALVRRIKLHVQKLIFVSSSENLQEAHESPRLRKAFYSLEYRRATSPRDQSLRPLIYCLALASPPWILF